MNIIIPELCHRRCVILDHYPTAEEVDDFCVNDRILIYDAYDYYLSKKGEDIALFRPVYDFVVCEVVDSNFLAVDMAISTNSEGFPVRVYVVGIEDSSLVVSHVASDKPNTDEWVYVFSIQGVVNAAIEFDGFWRETPRGRVFITDTQPMLFFVNSVGTLNAQVLNNDKSQAWIANDVVFVSALRGWLHQDETADNDTGLIVAYIKKNGRAYYRQFVWVKQPTAPGDIGLRVWRDEIELVFEAAAPPFKSISVSRTNDFRIAFTAEDSSGESFALLTRRYYQVDSFEPVYISAAPMLGNFNMVEPIYPEFVQAHMVSRTETAVKLSHDIYWVATNVHSSFSIVDELGRSVIIQGSRLLNANAIILEHAPFQMLDSGTATIRFTNTNTHTGVVRVINNGALFSPVSATFSIYVGDFVNRKFAFSQHGHFSAIAQIGITVHALTQQDTICKEHIVASIRGDIQEIEVNHNNTLHEENIVANVIGDIKITNVGVQPL